MTAGPSPVARMSMSPEVSAPRLMLPTLSKMTVGHAPRRYSTQESGRLGGVRQEMAPRVLPALHAGAQNQLLLFRAESFQRADAAVVTGRLELFDRLDAELRVEHGDGLRSDALEMEKIEDRRRKLFEKFPVISRFASVGNLADLRGQVLADAGNRAKLAVGAGGELVGGVGDGFSGVAVRAYLERVFVLDFEEIGDLIKNARDTDVFHVLNKSLRD